MNSKGGMDFLWNKNWKKWITLGVISLIVVIFFKYVFPWFWPVVLAFLVVSALYNRLLYIERRWHIKRMISMAIILLLSGATTIGILYGLITLCWGWCNQEINTAGNILSICKGILQKEGIQWMMNSGLSFGKYFFAIVAKVAVLGVMTLLLVREYGNVRKQYYQLPFSESVSGMKRRVSQMIRVYVRAQGIILVMIMVIVSIGMAAVGVSNFLFWGILTGILDVLPFIGTGLILFPFAIWMFLQKNIWQGILLIIIYAMCTLTRNLLEPRLIGEGMQISPVGILLSVFTGIKVYGATGVILGPLTFVLLLEVYHEIIDSDSLQFKGES